MRTVTVVLAGSAGALPDFEVSTPWWQDVSEFPPGVQVLRLLHGDRPSPPGGHVTYLAETTTDPFAPLEDQEPQLNRAPYARVGGPRATLAWAAEVFHFAAARQQRTWNLSAIWRLDGPHGETRGWIKQVPRFFAHEPAVLRLVDHVAPGLVPPLVAAGDEGRMILAHVPGEDGYGADARVCAAIAAAFHPVQEHFAGRVAPLLAAGVPDRRALDLAFARPYFATVNGLRELVEDLPRRMAAVASCGLPDTLVHGDLHPGNVRIGSSGRLTLLDWGDSVVGNPAYDILRLVEGLDEPAAVLSAWAARWSGADALRAVGLLGPVAALRSAAVYAGFLAAIEPDEHPYHAADVPERLAAAVAAA